MEVGTFVKVSNRLITKHRALKDLELGVTGINDVQEMEWKRKTGQTGKHWITRITRKLFEELVHFPPMLLCLLVISLSFQAILPPGHSLILAIVLAILVKHNEKIIISVIGRSVNIL